MEQERRDLEAQAVNQEQALSKDLQEAKQDFTSQLSILQGSQTSLEAQLSEARQQLEQT